MTAYQLNALCWASLLTLTVLLEHMTSNTQFKLFIELTNECLVTCNKQLFDVEIFSIFPSRTKWKCS